MAKRLFIIFTPAVLEPDVPGGDITFAMVKVTACGPAITPKRVYKHTK